MEQMDDTHGIFVIFVIYARDCAQEVLKQWSHPSRVLRPMSTGGNFRHSEAPGQSGRPEIGLRQGLGCSRISRRFKLWSSGASRLRLAESLPSLTVRFYAP